jgi:hypothetical protein
MNHPYKKVEEMPPPSIYLVELKKKKRKTKNNERLYSVHFLEKNNHFPFSLFPFFSSFLVGLGLNSGLCTCKAGTPPFEPHFQPYHFQLIF